jgi:hypothetical protein
LHSGGPAVKAFGESLFPPGASPVIRRAHLVLGDIPQVPIQSRVKLGSVTLTLPRWPAVPAEPKQEAVPRAMPACVSETSSGWGQVHLQIRSPSGTRRIEHSSDGRPSKREPAICYLTPLRQPVTLAKVSKSLSGQGRNRTIDTAIFNPLTRFMTLHAASPARKCLLLKDFRMQGRSCRFAKFLFECYLSATLIAHRDATHKVHRPIRESYPKCITSR